MQLHADFSTPEKRMDFVLYLARKNIEHRSGGPFAAAIFNQDTHQLIAVGVNLVESSLCSNHHAEMVAIALAEQTLQSYTLHGEHLPRCELISSCEPCAMCFGAIPWSGIKHLTYGATSADAQAIGFDEGAKHPDWVSELEKRGISVTPEISRNQAAQLLKDYQHHSGTVYNG